MSVPQDLTTNVVTANVTVVTTAETVAVVSDPAKLQYRHARVFVLGWLELATGTDTATVIPRIRRGSLATGTLVSGEDAVTIGAAVGSTEEFMIMASEERVDETDVTYCMTIEMTSASANGTVLQAGILVITL